MKQIQILLSLLLLLLVVSCSKEETKNEGQKVIINQEQEKTESPAEKESPAETKKPITEVGGAKEDPVEYVFRINGKDIKPKMPYSEASSILGKPIETGSSPSCAFEGEDKVYRFKGFDVQTGIVGGKEIIAGILFHTADVSTPEGVKIGDSLDKVKKTYGPKYLEDIGKYTYKSKDVQLIFIEEEGKIISISYIGIFESQ